MQDTLVRERSLREANATRVAISRVKRRLAAGELDIEEAFEQPEVGTMRVGHLLGALPFVGPYRAAKMCRKAGVSSVDRRVRDLAPHQIFLLCEQVRGANV